MIKSYLNADDSEYVSKWIRNKVDDRFIEVDKACVLERLGDFEDSMDEVEFHEIYFIENHKLKSIVVSAAPQIKVYTSQGLYLGNTGLAYSCLNYYGGQKQKNRDSIFYLGNMYSIINFDSIEERGGLKRTYGMKLSLSIWHDLSYGFNKVIDLKTNATIPAPEVMEYSPFDSLEQIFCGDSLPATIKKIKAESSYKYFSDIGISQDWYYNKTKNIFFTDIRKAYLYVNYMDEKSAKYLKEKRFEIIF